jgi:hypothetical protein
LTVDPDVLGTGQPYAYTDDDPVNDTDPAGLYNQLRTLASTSVGELYYAALNQVTTGRGGNVKPGMVRVQFQISARGTARLGITIIAAGIVNETRGLSGYDQETPPDVYFQPTAHPSVLAYPGDVIGAYGYIENDNGAKLSSRAQCTHPGRNIRERDHSFPVKSTWMSMRTIAQPQFHRCSSHKHVDFSHG